MAHEQQTIVFTREQIACRVEELGKQITAEYAGREKNQSLVLLCVLNGAFIFAADLCRAIDLDVELDFIRVKSYGDATRSSGSIDLVKSAELDVTQKDIILIEDIVDSGHTAAWLTHHFKDAGASSVKLCALIDKTERRETEVAIDYAGFAAEQGFLVGYGLDYAERYRNLPDIVSLEE